MRMLVNVRVFALANVEGKTKDEAVAAARSLIAQYVKEDRAWEFAKLSFVPLVMLAFALVL